MTDIKKRIAFAFEETCKIYLKSKLLVGKLATTEFKNFLNKGDEVEVAVPDLKTLFDYDGGDLPSTETIRHCKLRIDRGKAFHFTLSPEDEKNIYINKSLLEELISDAIKQFAAAIDSAYSNLYTRACHYLDDNGNAISLTPNIAKDILAYMQAKFQRGIGKGHTNWIDGNMVCILPTQYQYFLGDKNNYCGWDIVYSSNIAQPEQDVYYPLFGVKGKTLAGVVSSLTTTFYVPEKSFDTNYKGYGLYGVAAANSDYLGTVKIHSVIDSFRREHV